MGLQERTAADENGRSTRRLQLVAPAAGGGTMTDELRSALSSALDGPPDVVRRLRHADTSVLFVVGTADADAGVTLLCDERRVEVVEGDSPAEITIELTEQQLRRLCAGQLSFPLLVMTGELTFQGPIRKFLTVAAVLRSLLARRAQSGGRVLVGADGRSS